MRQRINGDLEWNWKEKNKDRKTRRNERNEKEENR